MPVTQPLPSGPFTTGSGTPGPDAAALVAFLTQKGTATDAEMQAAIVAASTADRTRANHTGTQAVGTITGLAAVATSGLKADVGLGLVDNTADTSKPVSTAQAAADNLRLLASANLSDVALPATARTNLGLGNVDNTSDVNKPVSTAQATAIGLKADKLITTTSQVGTAYTLVLADAATLVELTNAAAIALTIPANATAAFAIGSVVAQRQFGAGQVTVTPAAGVTIRSRGGALKIAGQYGEASIVKRGSDEWIIVGDVVV